MIPGLPQWRCHKVVGAFKIERIEPVQVDVTGGSLYRYRLHGWRAEDGNRYVEVSLDFFRARRSDNSGQLKIPDEYVGGYLVQYDDGYLSWSPAEAFESGYTPVGHVGAGS